MSSTVAEDQDVPPHIRSSGISSLHTDDDAGNDTDYDTDSDLTYEELVAKNHDEEFLKQDADKFGRKSSGILENQYKRTVTESGKDVVNKNNCCLTLAVLNEEKVCSGFLKVLHLQVGVKVKRISPAIEEDDLWKDRIYVVILSPRWIGDEVVLEPYNFECFRIRLPINEVLLIPEPQTFVCGEDSVYKGQTLFTGRNCFILWSRSDSDQHVLLTRLLLMSQVLQ